MFLSGPADFCAGNFLSHTISDLTEMRLNEAFESAPSVSLSDLDEYEQVSSCRFRVLYPCFALLQHACHQFAGRAAHCTQRLTLGIKAPMPEDGGRAIPYDDCACVQREQSCTVFALCLQLDVGDVDVSLLTRAKVRELIKQQVTPNKILLRDKLAFVLGTVMAM